MLVAKYQGHALAERVDSLASVIRDHPGATTTIAGPWLEVHAVQCEAEWPSPVTGGMTDAQCVEPATVELDGARYCKGCAWEVGWSGGPDDCERCANRDPRDRRDHGHWPSRIVKA